MTSPRLPDSLVVLERGWLSANNIIGFDGEAATMVDGFTVMHKGPAGYAPAANDWWWARVNEDGSIAVSCDGGGETQLCVDCHAPASGTDLVLGVDPADHAP